MAKNVDVETVEGVVEEALANARFMVVFQVGSTSEGTSRDVRILCTIAGKMRQNYIRILPGDKVKIEISKMDLSRGIDQARGRIVYRYR